MNVPIDYDNEKELTNNVSEITGVLKHKIEKKVEMRRLQECISQI